MSCSVMPSYAYLVGNTNPRLALPTPTYLCLVRHFRVLHFLFPLYLADLFFQTAERSKNIRGWVADQAQKIDW